MYYRINDKPVLLKENFDIGQISLVWWILIAILVIIVVLFLIRLFM